MGGKMEVKIEVIGGVAYVVEKPKGVSIAIHDYDNEERCEDGEYEPEFYDENFVITYLQEDK